MHAISILKEQLASPKRVAIVMHTKPDADAFGTSLALALFLRAQGHMVQVIAPTHYPNFLSWLPAADTVFVAENEDEETIMQHIEPIDVLFCVDFSTTSRAGTLAFLLQKTNVLKVIIDHHTEPEDFADILIWDIKAAASAQVAFELFKEWGGEEQITKDIATCLYVGILTDTNSFKNPNTTAQTHRIVAELIDRGVDTAGNQRLIYDNKTLNKLLFFSFAVSQRLVVLPEFHTAYFVIQKEDYKRYDLQNGDTEGLVDYALSLKGTLLGAVLKEKDDTIYLSLRSVGDVPANLIAKKYFQGGGHKNAAGGTSKFSLTETVDHFESIVRSGQFKFQYTNET
ncbi:MAG TPA: DHH family phosphoesterase [Amoebophilaceae bacterium]|jgi:phosphoesterase RecJ-like protein|nr:DHH family phosphoesterase [Amoebophilaceae bacterium]